MPRRDTDLHAVLQASRRHPAGLGRLILFLSPDSHADAGAVAREVALLAQAQAKRAVWLIDLDPFENAQFEALQATSAPEHGFGKALDAALGETSFLRLIDARSGEVDRRGSRHLLVAHQWGASRLYVTRFRREAIGPGQKVQLLTSDSYWSRLAQVVDFAMIVAKPPQALQAGLAIAAHVGACVMVIGPQTRLQDAQGLREAVRQQGGQWAGVVMTQSGGLRGRFGGLAA